MIHTLIDFLLAWSVLGWGITILLRKFVPYHWWDKVPNPLGHALAFAVGPIIWVEALIDD